MGFQYQSLFYIESPFQLMQAFELVDSFSDYRVVIRLGPSEPNNSQLKNLVSLFKLHNVTYVYCVSQYQCSILVIKLIVSSLRCSNIFIGDENSRVFKIVRYFLARDKVILLDDGVATINSKPENKLYRRFTLFDSEQEDNMVNRFERIRSFIGRQQQTRSISVIVGGKLVEEGIVSRETYLKVIGKMVSNSDNSLDLIYIPHRGEKSENLEILKRSFGVSIVRTRFPIELIEYELNSKLISIHSTFSTAIFSMGVIVKDVKILVYQIEEDKILSRGRAIKNQYSRIESNPMIRIIEV